MKTDIHKVFADFFEPEELKCIAYELNAKLAEGHICVPVDFAKRDFDEETEKNPFLEGAQTVLNQEPSFMHELISSKEEEQANRRQPFVFHKGNYYIQRYFTYESEILAQIQSFIQNDTPDVELGKLKGYTPLINQLFSDFVPDAATPEENIHWQAVAALSSAIHNFSIITGGPGTGKTTTVAKLLSLLFSMDPESKIALVAPTGKAASRMKESLIQAKERMTYLEDSIQANFDALDASTIHRLLGYKRNSHYFKHNKENPLPYDVVIVDETSMVGASLMAKLLSAIKPEAKVVLLGDKDQLASVEAGSIFGDMCLTQENRFNKLTPKHRNWINSVIPVKEAMVNSSFEFSTGVDSENNLANHIIELKRSYRFKGQEAIGVFSKAVIKSELTEEIIEDCATKPNTPIKQQTVDLSETYKEKDFHTLFDQFKDYIEERETKLALQTVNKARILCVVKDGPYGVFSMNKNVEEYLASENRLKPTDGFYHNQPIMITGNDYELGLFNGDVGLVRENEKKELIAYFETMEGTKEFHTSRLGRWQTVFAMTIHKSQGSEFDHVGVVLPTNAESQLLTKELIYTGITRAKQSAIIFGSKEVLLEGSQREVVRASGLTERLKQELNLENTQK